MIPNIILNGCPEFKSARNYESYNLKETGLSDLNSKLSRELTTKITETIPHSGHLGTKEGHKLK
jgi:hypothetical protein